MIQLSRLTVWTASVFVAALFLSFEARSQTEVELPMNSATAVAEWRAAHDVARVEFDQGAMRVDIDGADPYIHGPARDFPGDDPWSAEIELRSEYGGAGQLFFYETVPTEERSVRFRVPAGEWTTVRLALPRLGNGVRFRLDPPGDHGSAWARGIRFSPRRIWESPTFGAPEVYDVPDNGFLIGARDGLNVRADFASLDRMVWSLGARRIAATWSEPRFAYVEDGNAIWFEPAKAEDFAVDIRLLGLSYELVYTFSDPHGAGWVWRRILTPLEDTGRIEVETRLEVDQDRSLLFAPLLTLLAGDGAFGARKNQGLFAGLEYLEDEPSSSEADLRGPESKRQIPDHAKITFPLMAVQADGAYLGFIWDPRSEVSAIFDSPNRFLSAENHWMGLAFPGSNGMDREADSLTPFAPVTLSAREPVSTMAIVIAGEGETVAPAIREYVKLRDLPEIPESVPSKFAYGRVAAKGWLESDLNENGRFRHAVWGDRFGAQPAADAVMYMQALLGWELGPALRGALRDGMALAKRRLRTEDFGSALIGHVREPTPALIYGGIGQTSASLTRRARSQLNALDSRGTLPYVAPADGTDFGATHFEDHSSGMSGLAVKQVLEAAAFSGDPDLVRDGVEALERLFSTYRNGIPRGAQTWEVPLHTPDIMASAHMVEAALWGWRFSGDERWLDRARYWAWTGVPFVYLEPTTTGDVGPYATIPVFGATHWVSPVWIGRPVQWCGLVYAAALRKLAQEDPNGPWLQLANGITASGVQQTWPESDPERVGLLPDFFELGAQRRDGPAINPGTLQVSAFPYYGEPPFMTSTPIREASLVIHAPGALEVVSATDREIVFRIRSWPERKAYCVVSGIRPDTAIRVEVNGVDRTSDVEREDRVVFFEIPGSAVSTIRVSADRALGAEWAR